MLAWFNIGFSIQIRNFFHKISWDQFWVIWRIKDIFSEKQLFFHLIATKVLELAGTRNFPFNTVFLHPSYVFRPIFSSRFGPHGEKLALEEGYFFHCQVWISAPGLKSCKNRNSHFAFQCIIWEFLPTFGFFGTYLGQQITFPPQFVP